MEDALSEPDARAAADVEQGAAELPEPAFVDDEGPMAPPAHVSTVRLRDVLASLTDAELAALPGRVSKEEIERRRHRVGAQRESAPRFSASWDVVIGEVSQDVGISDTNVLSPSVSTLISV